MALGEVDGVLTDVWGMSDYGCWFVKSPRKRAILSPKPLIRRKSYIIVLLGLSWNKSLVTAG